jgi:hypothetical protein
LKNCQKLFSFLLRTPVLFNGNPSVAHFSITPWEINFSVTK